MRRKIIFLFLITAGLLLFKGVLAEAEKFYCDFDNHSVFSCQKNVFVATGPPRLDRPVEAGQPLTIKDRDGFTFYITPQADLGLEATQYKFLTLRLKAKTDFPRFQINFADRGVGILTLNDFIFKNNNRFTPLDIANSSFQTRNKENVSAKLNKNSAPNSGNLTGFTDYYFNLSLFDQWGGTVDRLYLQFVPQDIEIESFALSPTTPALMIKSLWQEFLTDQPERLSWINGLSVPSLSGVPFIKYLLAIVLIVVAVLAIFKYRDKALAQKWPKILLTIFLVGWLIAAARTLYSSYSTYLNDRPLWRIEPGVKSEKIVGALVNSPEGAKNLYSFLALIKANIPAGAAIFMPPDSSYVYVLMVYNLVDQYQIVADINQADYLVLSEQSPPASTSESSSLGGSATSSLGGSAAAPDFKLKFTFGPNQLIYQR